MISEVTDGAGVQSISLYSGLCGFWAMVFQAGRSEVAVVNRDVWPLSMITPRFLHDDVTCPSDSTSTPALPETS